MKIFGYSTTRNYLPSGECIRCPNCGTQDLKENVRDSIEGTALEVSTDCPSCREMVGYWAHGYYDPCFMFGDKSIPALVTRLSCKIRGVATP